MLVRETLYGTALASRATDLDQLQVEIIAK